MPSFSSAPHDHCVDYYVLAVCVDNACVTPSLCPSVLNKHDAAELSAAMVTANLQTAGLSVTEVSLQQSVVSITKSPYLLRSSLLSSKYIGISAVYFN